MGQQTSRYGVKGEDSWIETPTRSIETIPTADPDATPTTTTTTTTIIVKNCTYYLFIYLRVHCTTVLYFLPYYLYVVCIHGCCYNFAVHGTMTNKINLIQLKFN